MNILIGVLMILVALVIYLKSFRWKWNHWRRMLWWMSAYLVARTIGVYW